MKNKLWELFKLTGGINYYIMYKEMETLENEQNQSEGNSNK